jgi:hypothetical protein
MAYEIDLVDLARRIAGDPSGPTADIARFYSMSSSARPSIIGDRLMPASWQLLR